MTQLVKDTKTSVIPGRIGTTAILGTPGRAAYYSVELVETKTWVDGPGITWGWVPRERTSATGYWGYGSDGKPRWFWFGPESGGVLNDDFSYEYVPFYLGSRNIGNHPLKVWDIKTVQRVVYHPAVPAIAAVPYEAPRPHQIKYSLNVGWNSYARSIEPLEKGQFFEFTVATGLTGAFIGVGYSGLYGKPITAFPNGIIVEPAGVRVQEYGADGELFFPTPTPAAKIKVFRQEDNSIVYVVTSGTLTKVATSANTPPRGDLYIHAYLYSGGDTVLSAEYKTGKVVFGGTA